MEDKMLDKKWLKEHPKDALFLKLIKGCRIEERNKHIFYVKKDIIMMKYSIKDRSVDLHEDLIWFEFSKKFHDNTEQILFDMVKTYTKFSIDSIEDIGELSPIFYDEDTEEMHCFNDCFDYRPY